MCWKRKAKAPPVTAGLDEARLEAERAAEQERAAKARRAEILREVAQTKSIREQNGLGRLVHIALAAPRRR